MKNPVQPPVPAAETTSNLHLTTPETPTDERPIHPECLGGMSQSNFNDVVTKLVRDFIAGFDAQVNVALDEALNTLCLDHERKRAIKHAFEEVRWKHRQGGAA